MINSVLESIKNMEEGIKKIMMIIIKISFGICILSSIILLTYILNSKLLITYEAGLILFKTGIVLFAFGFMCSFVFNNLRNRIF